MKRLPLKPFLLVATLSALAPALPGAPFTAQVSSLAKTIDVDMAGLTSLAPTLHAQAPVVLDPAFLAGYSWRNLGPDRGGRSIAVSGVKGRPREAYFGATGGGLWKTIDGGGNWFAVTDFQITTASIGAVAVAETDPDLVFIGTGETCIRGNILPGDGVYRSRDGGESWEHIGFRESHGISRIRIHPTDPDIVYVASFGKYGVPSEERGVFRSTDGGDSWERILFRDERTGAIDLTLDRNNPDVLYAPADCPFCHLPGGSVQADIWRLVARVRDELQSEFKPAGFNVGLNEGQTAGQTMDHAHVHVIPRFEGDVADPRGGIRWVAPERAAYWDE